ncbi:MAG: Trk system potassium transporter TrkA [Bacteroidales bacterium]|nr:Trk system potassium transporter TrkA [Bacteroidales bacterium]
MNIIIAGDGEVGFNLAEALVNSNHNIFIIDPHEELLKRIESHADLMTIVGESNSVSVLRKAHVDKADLVISVLHEEPINVLTAILAKKLGAKKVIARVNTLNHVKDDIKKVYEELGIDIFISPEDIAAKEIVSLIHQAQVIEKVDYHEGKLTVYSFKIEPEAPLIGKNLFQIAAEYPHLEFRVVSMRREGQRLVPSGETDFRPDDLVYIISKPKFFNELTLLTGKKKIEVNNIMMVGGGRVGRVAAMQLEHDYNVKVFEINYNRCEELTEMFENALVIHGDARDIELLKEEDIQNADVFIAVTEDTETNILTCLHARKFGVKKTFALVENLNYIEIAQSVGIDTVLNKKLIASSYILQYAMGAQVKSLRRLGGIHAEMLELIARPGSLVTKKPIQNIRFPEGTIIGGITRGEEDFIAVGDFQIKENDKVIVFSLPGNIARLEKLFQKKSTLL